MEKERREKGSGSYLLRYYDPDIGAFISVDPVSVSTTTGWNFCRYCYAAHNPCKFNDPDGRAIQALWGRRSALLLTLLRKRSQTPMRQSISSQLLSRRV